MASRGLGVTLTIGWDNPIEGSGVPFKIKHYDVMDNGLLDTIEEGLNSVDEGARTKALRALAGMRARANARAIMGRIRFPMELLVQRLADNGYDIPGLRFDQTETLIGSK